MANSTSQLIQEQLVHLQYARLATNEVPSDYLEKTKEKKRQGTYFDNNCLK